MTEKKIIPTFAIIGNAGSGKSTLCNSLTSSNNYKESSSIYAETKETIGFSGNFNGQDTFVIDTPGLQDGSGLDAPHLVQMTQYIKSKAETQAFIVVINFFQYRFDDSIKKLFRLIGNMYPEKKWYNNLAVVWSHYFSNLPENVKDKTPKLTEFKNWFKTNIAPDISDIEASNIPQYFVDSCEARNQGNDSNSELAHLLGWIGQLDPLANKFGEIQAPDKDLKEKKEIKETKIISETQKLNIKTVISAEFRKFHCVPYIGEPYDTDPEEIEGTRKEEQIVLPVEKLGPETIEKMTDVVYGGRTRVETNHYSYKNNPFGRRHHVTDGYYYTPKITIVKERTCQPMTDGTTVFGEWKEISRNTEITNKETFYENHT